MPEHGISPGIADIRFNNTEKPVPGKVLAFLYQIKYSSLLFNDLRHIHCLYSILNPYQINAWR